MSLSGKHRVVIVGGGFGGLTTAKALRKTPVDITLVDRRNFHLFQPLLYQVATGGLSPGNIAAPLRSIFSRQRNVHVVMDEVIGFDLPRRRVLLQEGELAFDSLVVAAGAKTGYFGNDQWAENAPGLKTVEDAIEIRGRVLTAFEEADKLPTPQAREHLLTFVVVGAGPTGVELAGTLAEIARHTLRHDFRIINPAETRIILIDAAPRILMAYAEDLALNAQKKLMEMGVEVRTQVKIQKVDASGVEVVTAQGVEQIAAANVLWAAGVTASPLAKLLSEATGALLDRQGRIEVQSDLTLPGHPQVYVIGDMAHFKLPSGQAVPGVAPAAMQQGKYVAKAIQSRFQNISLPPFTYTDLGSMATIGRKAAIAQIGTWKFTGLIAWILWLFIHLIQIVSFESRILVLIQWAWNYLTFSRSARLITQSGYTHGGHLRATHVTNSADNS